MRTYRVTLAAFAALHVPLILACGGELEGIFDTGEPTGGGDEVVFPPSDLGCDDLDLVTASHWSTSSYYPGSPHQECRCRSTFDPEVSVTSVSSVRVTAAARSKQTHGEVPWGATDDATPTTTNTSVFSGLPLSTTDTVNGDYDVYFSLYKFDGTEVEDCDEYAPVRWSLDADPVPMMPPPPKSSARGQENDLQCLQGGLPHARFELAFRPGSRHLELLKTSGDARYAGTWVDAVEVTSFGTATGVVVEVPGQPPLTLRPDAPFATLPRDAIAFGHLRTKVLVEGGGAPGEYPELDLALRCPPGPPPPPLPEEVGYRLSPADYGLPGEAKYVLRLVPDGSQDPDTRHLMVEVQGRAKRTGVPVTRIDATRWRVATTVGRLDLVGTIEVLPNELVLRVDQGTIAGVDVSGQELHVPAYP